MYEMQSCIPLDLPVNIINNPALWWFCPDCVCLKSGEHSGSNAETGDNLSSTTDVMLHNTLASFKKEMLPVTPGW